MNGFSKTFCLCSQLSDTACLKDSIDVDPKHLESLAADAFERRISTLERENKELQRKFKGTEPLFYQIKGKASLGCLHSRTLF